MECLLPYLCMVTVPHIMVGLERMLDYRGVGLVRFHCTHCTMFIGRTRLNYVLTSGNRVFANSQSESHVFTT